MRAGGEILCNWIRQGGHRSGRPLPQSPGQEWGTRGCSHSWRDWGAPAAGRWSMADGRRLFHEEQFVANGKGLARAGGSGLFGWVWTCRLLCGFVRGYIEWGFWRLAASLATVFPAFGRPTSQKRNVGHPPWRNDLASAHLFAKNSIRLQYLPAADL